VSEEYPVDEPGNAAPAWVVSPTAPWERVPDPRRDHRDRNRDEDDDRPAGGRPRPQATGRTYGSPAAPPPDDDREPPRRRDAGPVYGSRDREREPRPTYQGGTGREWGRDQIPLRGRDRTAPPEREAPPARESRERRPRPAGGSVYGGANPFDRLYEDGGRYEDFRTDERDERPSAIDRALDRSMDRADEDLDEERDRVRSRRARERDRGDDWDDDRNDTGELPRLPETAGDFSGSAVDNLPEGTPFSVSPAGPTYTSAPLTGAGVDGLQATGYLPIVRPGAAGFPPELAALADTIKPPPDVEPAPEPEAPPEPPPPPPPPDPEQLLAAFVWRFDPDTLREQIEGDEVTQLEGIRDQLTEKLNGVSDNPTRARLLSLRAVVSRILGDLLKAFADAKLALAHAEATGELRRVAIAQARLAHVLQFREEYDEADRLFTLANSTELPDRLRATMHQHAGRCAYDQGRYMEACNHFESALDLRKEEDPELIAQTELALDAVFRRVAEKGWGPYPRTREEILQIRKPPSPAFDENTQRWGFVDAEFNFCIGPGYVDVQPFRDGVAWVQRQGSETWELIDDTGKSLIDPSAGYLGVSSFSDGLAWVSRDGTTRWIAIDKANEVLISTGFDDVRPFRRGVSAVRRGPRWGAVDGVGRVVVPFQFDGFATALADGRYIDGFNDEGLAVVSLGGRKGVVDRAGRVIVPPMHPVLMIHPVAFLVADESQRWGALDRRGRLIIEQTFPSRMDVTDEIDRLLADTRPVM
jgi:tetratricopeptide (TPR) repeat protein